MNRMIFRTWACACALALVALAACGGGGGGAATTGTGGGAVATGTLQVSVINSQTGQPVQGATVTAGGVTATTGANGQASLQNVPVGTTQFSVSGNQFATNYRSCTITAGGTYTANVQLLPVTVQQIDPTIANTVTAGAASVQLAANSLVDANGNVVQGPVTARLAAIDPTAGLQTMPGQLVTQTAGGVAAPLQSYGAVTATFADATTGAPLNLAAGQTATVTIPVAAGAVNPPANVPLYYFDAATNQWVQQGTAALNAAGTAYVGTVPHFSYWNADQTYNTATITGCVQDANGNPVAGAEIDAQGNSYIGLSEAYTDAQGNFQVPVMANGTVLVWAENHLAPQFSQTNTSRVVAGAAGTTTALPACLTFGNAGATGGTINIKLTWGLNPSDLDSHLTGPDGAGGRFHVYYMNMQFPAAPPVEAALDVDDTTSFGPEIITINTLRQGVYKYSVHHFAGTSTILASPARVELNINGRLQVFTPPQGNYLGGGDVWRVFDLVVDAAGNVTVQPVNTIANNQGSVGPIYTPTTLGKAKPPINNWPW